MTKQEIRQRYDEVIKELLEVNAERSALSESGYLSYKANMRMTGEINQLKLELEQLFTLAFNYKDNCCTSWATHD